MYEKKVPQPTGPSRSRFVASSSNSGSRCGGGNGVDNACAPCSCPFALTAPTAPATTTSACFIYGHLFPSLLSNYSFI